MSIWTNLCCLPVVSPFADILILPNEKKILGPKFASLVWKYDKLEKKSRSKPETFLEDLKKDRELVEKSILQDDPSKTSLLQLYDEALAKGLNDFNPKSVSTVSQQKDFSNRMRIGHIVTIIVAISLAAFTNLGILCYLTMFAAITSLSRRWVICYTYSKMESTIKEIAFKIETNEARQKLPS